MEEKNRTTIENVTHVTFIFVFLSLHVTDAQFVYETRA